MSPKFAFHRAAKDGKTAEIELLLLNDVEIEEVDQEGFTPLLRAAQGGHCKTIDALLNAGADINATNTKDEGSSVLHYAVKSKSKDAVKSLLRQGAYVDASASTGASSSRWTPLFYAATGGDLEMIELLLQHDADITRDGARLTPIYYGEENGNVSMEWWENIVLTSNFKEKRRKHLLKRIAWTATSDTSSDSDGLQDQFNSAPL